MKLFTFALNFLPTPSYNFYKDNEFNTLFDKLNINIDNQIFQHLRHELHGKVILQSKKIRLIYQNIL